MKVAVVPLPDNWEPGACEKCPVSEWRDTLEGDIEEYCVLQVDVLDECPLESCIEER